MVIKTFGFLTFMLSKVNQWRSYLMDVLPYKDKKKKKFLEPVLSFKTVKSASGCGDKGGFQKAEAPEIPAVLHGHAHKPGPLSPMYGALHHWHRHPPSRVMTQPMEEKQEEEEEEECERVGVRRGCPVCAQLSQTAESSCSRRLVLGFTALRFQISIISST